MASTPKRRWLAPEVVQTSAMDCGPAALKCLLEGFGIPVSYGRLREACQTTVDGTSIDTLEEVAQRLGLEAEQVLMPPEHVPIDAAQALPAIAVLQKGFAMHFVVVWRRLGPLVQLMDPVTGRGWTTCRSLTDQLLRHTVAVPAGWWDDIAGSEPFVSALCARIARLGEREGLARALGDVGDVGTLDAVVRMVESFERCGAVRRGREARALLRSLFDRCRDGDPTRVVPERYWTVRRGEPGDAGPADEVLVRGAVLVRIRGVRGSAVATGGDEAEDTDERGEPSRGPLPPELEAALAEPPMRPAHELSSLLRRDGNAVLVAIGAGLAMASAGVMLEALLFRGLLELGRYFGPWEQRLVAVGVVLLVLAGLLLLQLPLTAGVLGLGRRLEVRLRHAFLAKIPRLGDRYFRSRTASDMAARLHGAHQLRLLPARARELVQAAGEIVATTIGLAVLVPAHLSLVVLTGLACLLVPLGIQPLLYERDLRVREHAAALHRLALDSLLGLVPIRSHGMERVVERLHEEQLTEWVRSSRSLARARSWLQAAHLSCVYGLSAWLLLRHVGDAGELGSALLVIYWTLGLPAASSRLEAAVGAYPELRSLALRLLEPLGAPEEGRGPTAARTTAPADGAASIHMREISAVAGGHVVLDGIDLDVAPGEHVAIVGSSGAGKSTLVGLLLGWYRPAGGRILVDGEPLDGDHVDAVRRATAWVDPAVQLWNRSLLDNLGYGAPEHVATSIEEIIGAAELMPVLQAMPEGMQTSLGEGGCLVSGGEGQRVRIGRALLRRQARLVILDEPFRGLDRGLRHALLDRVRRHWSASTLLCITHDVGDARAFARVVVVDDGRIVEDGAPQELLARASCFRELVEAEARIRDELWGDAGWRRLRVEGGRVEAGP